MKRRTLLAGSLAVAVRLAAPGGVLALAGCGSPSARDVLTRISGPTMGTAYRVSLAERLSRDEIQALRERLGEILNRVDALMSPYRPESELSRFNTASAGQHVDLSGDTVAVVAEALRVSALSSGAFDATVGPLVDLWGFGPRRADVVPSEAAIADASAVIDSRAVRFDAARGVLSKAFDGLRLDLCGVAKGYAVDLVAAHLDAVGLDAYLVDVGGELKARGRKADGTPWRVGIERPLHARREVQRVVAMDQGAIATSGDYRNFFESGGHRYAHTIDPRTGYPARHALGSVSVLADSAMTADALSTAIMVLGPDDGMALAESLDLPALLLSRSRGGPVERATRSFSERTAA